MGKPKTLPSENPLVHEVVELLRELLHTLLAASVPAWLDIQLTLPQLRALFVIAHNQTSSVIQIANYLGIGEPAASHLVDKLMRAGLVNRNVDPMDRRRAVVQLSSSGEELIEKILGWEKFLREQLYKIPEKELFFFREGLNAIMRETQGQTTNDEQK